MLLMAIVWESIEVPPMFSLWNGFKRHLASIYDPLISCVDSAGSSSFSEAKRLLTIHNIQRAVIWDGL